MGVGEARSAALAARDDVMAIVSDHQRPAARARQTARDRAAAGSTSRRPAFGLEPLQIDHHLKRPAIMRAQVDDTIGGKLRTTDAADKMRDITHEAATLSRTELGINF